MPVKEAALNNLQHVWKTKKRIERVTQTQAAAELGWTQSAFSQYLNGTTALNPTAIIKLAKYFNMHPTDIDPSIYSGMYCPNCGKSL